MGRAARLPKSMVTYTTIVSSSDNADRWQVAFQIRAAAIQNKVWLEKQHQRALAVAMSLVEAAANTENEYLVRIAVENFGEGVLGLLEEMARDALNLERIVKPDGKVLTATDCGMTPVGYEDVIIQATTDRARIESGEFQPPNFDFHQMAVS